MPDETNEIMTIKDVADYVHVPLSTVYAWNTKGTGPTRIRVGKHVRYRKSEVDRWLDAQAEAVPA